MTEIGTVIDGKYQILKEIGRGGMSVVYLAMDTHLNKQWAVKEIRKRGSGKNDEIVVNSLLAEANMMKRLDHPALPRIVDIIDNGITIYVVMDYIEGESLDKILNEFGAQPEEKVINWAMQIADALSYLHSQKPSIIYRDMKPANVMLKPEGNIKIIDFGIAREYKEQSLADTTVLGTKGYAPPEQYSGQTDPRSDIFALGMTMHHLLTGVDPRSGEAYAPVRQWNPEVSEGVEIIIDRCVQPAAENRYQNCADLIYDLEHPELITKGFKKKQKRKLATFITAAVLAVVMGISGFACSRAATYLTSQNYNNLIQENSSMPLAERVENCKKAMALIPEDPRAFQSLLNAYKDANQFGDNESKTLSNLYSTYSSGWDKTSVEVAQINYEIGKMYFNYYYEGDDPSQRPSMSKKATMAKTYFAANSNNQELPDTFEEKDRSECYNQICKFYEQYITNQVSGDEATVNDYRELFNVIETTIDSLENDDGANGADKLTLCNSAFFMIYDERINLAKLGYDQTEVLAMFDRLKEKAGEIPANKEQNKKMLDEIQVNHESCRESIINAYKNAEKE